jgi:hypothetical protein
VALVLVGAMIVMNLFIAVLTDNYDSAEQANEDELGKEEEVDQEQAITAAVLLLEHTNPMRKKCLHIARSKWFERGIMCCILINTVIMMMQFAPRTPSPDAYSYPVGELKAEYGFMPTPYFWFLWVMNTILTVIFTVEAVIKLLGLGPKIYAMDNFNIFDCVVVVISIVEVLLDVLGFAGVLAASLPGLSALRALRIFRIMKLVRSIESLRQILEMLASSINSVLFLLMLLGLFVFIFSLLGMELFGGFYPRPETQYNYSKALFPDVFATYHIRWSDDPPFTNFDSFGDAFLSIFVVLSGENWNDIWHDSHAATWAYMGPVATIYFLFLFVIGNLLLFNLFIAILIANAENKADDEEEEEDAAELDPGADPAFSEKA